MWSKLHNVTQALESNVFFQISISFNRFFDGCKPLTLFVIKHTLLFGIIAAIVLTRSDIIRLKNNNNKITFEINCKIKSIKNTVKLPQEEKVS